MRIRRLLFVFAFLLLGGSTPLYAALGDAPRCLLPAAGQGTKEIADANLPIPKLRPAVLSYAPEERDYSIRTIAFEASGEPEEGKAAVAHAILNRKMSGRWGDNIKDAAVMGARRGTAYRQAHLLFAEGGGRAATSGVVHRFDGELHFHTDAPRQRRSSNRTRLRMRTRRPHGTIA